MNLRDWQTELQLYLVERRPLLIGVAFLVAAVLVGSFAAWPLWGQYQTTQRKVRSIGNEVKKLSTRTSLLQGLDAEDESNFDRAENALPLQKQPFASLLLLNEVASRSGILVSSYDLNPGVVSTGSAEGVPQEGVQIFPLEVKVQGTTTEIQEAFRLFETSLPLIQVIEFSMSPVQNASGSNALMTSEMTLHVYFAPLSAPDVIKTGAQPLSGEQQKTLDTLKQFTIWDPQEVLPTQNFIRFNNQDFLGE